MERKRHNPYFRRLLVGYDGSSQSKKAFDVALSFAQCVYSRLLIFAVARPPEPSTSVELEAVLDDAREHYEADFQKLLKQVEGTEIEVETAIAVGHPAEQIIHRAETDHIDLIILGHRGTSVFAKLILGSISERVLRYAHCPVMIVR